MQQEIIIDNSVEQYKLTTDEFVYAQADGNYTRIYITHPEADKDGGTVTVTMHISRGSSEASQTVPKGLDLMVEG